MEVYPLVFLESIAMTLNHIQNKINEINTCTVGCKLNFNKIK